MVLLSLFYVVLIGAGNMMLLDAMQQQEKSGQMVLSWQDDLLPKKRIFLIGREC